MSGVGKVILFEAVTRPPAGLSTRGMRWLCGLAAAAAAVPALLFAVLGAWPVLGFVGGELLLVLGLVALHRRWNRAAEEIILLTEDGLLVRRHDGRGLHEEVRLDPYWSRLELEERAGAVPVLRAHARGRSVEIGRFLSPEGEQELEQALTAALRGYRTPRFDNPQLRA
jgi:uncharacterized membrane protein